MKNSYMVYMQGVMESESGWGQKHDGYAIALTRKDLEAFGSQVNGNLVWGDYSCYGILYGEVKNIEITEEAKKLIESLPAGVLWVDDISPYLFKP